MLDQRNIWMTYRNAPEKHNEHKSEVEQGRPYRYRPDHCPIPVLIGTFSQAEITDAECQLEACDSELVKRLSGIAKLFFVSSYASPPPLRWGRIKLPL